MASSTLPGPLAAHPILSAAFLLFGLVTAVYHFVSIVSFLAVYTKPSRLGRYLHASRDGRPAWALVTGASAGIGKAFAHELAARGFNVVLHGRNEAKLEGVRDELARAFPAREFRVLVADASLVPCANCPTSSSSTSPSSAVDFSKIVASLQDLNLTVLVNNAGGAASNPTFDTLPAFSQATIVGNVSLNALFPILMMKHLIPLLQRNAPALVINVGSISDNGLPFLSFYAASKAFLTTCSAVVARELALTTPAGQRPVEVLGIRVGSVTGVSHNAAEPSLFEPDARTMARAALARAGCGRPVVVGYLPHAVLQAIVGSLPGVVKDAMFARVMGAMRDEERAKMKAS